MSTHEKRVAKHDFLSYGARREKARQKKTEAVPNKNDLRSDFDESDAISFKDMENSQVQEILLGNTFLAPQPADTRKSEHKRRTTHKA